MGTKVGIDVAKAELVAAIDGVDGVVRFANDAAGLRGLVRWLREIDAELVAVEASGGYERALLDAVDGAGIAIGRVHATCMKAFHRACGKRAKTDPIDARVIARFAATMPLKRYVAPSAAAADLDAIVRARQALVEMAAGLKCRRRQAVSKPVRCAFDTVLKHLAKIAKQLEGHFGTLIDQDPVLREKASRVQCLGGFRTINTASLLVALPELGTVSRSEIAALAGVAPMSQDSGTKRGTRRIGGGRALARRPLYLAALTLIRKHPDFQARFRAFVARGKPKKVALTAIMRKLVVILNAVVREGALKPTCPVG